MSDIKINPLTKIPGGYFLDITFTDGSTSRSVNTKSPYHYVTAVITESLLAGKTVKSVFTSGGEPVYENGRFSPEFSSGFRKK